MPTSSTCPTAPRAHVSHVGPLVGGGVVLLHRAQALPGRSIIAPHGVQLPCNTHSHGSQCSHSLGDTSCLRAALGDRTAGIAGDTSKGGSSGLTSE